MLPGWLAGWLLVQLVLLQKCCYKNRETRFNGGIKNMYQRT